MTAFNVVRFKVKPGNEAQFVEHHRTARPGFKGFLGGNLIKTGEQTYCFVGEWRNFDSLVNARPQMISMLDSMREMLEDLGSGLGVTDPVSGQAVVRLPAPKPKKRATKARAGSKRPKAKRAKAKRAAKKR